MILATFNTEGFPIGFYKPEIHTEIPSGAIEISQQDYHTYISAPGQFRRDETGSIEYYDPPVSPAHIQQQLTSAVRLHLDEIAHQRNYDSIITAVSYSTSPHPKYGPEGIAARDWRDEVWDTCYQILADCQEGKRTIPTKEELIEGLPPMEWPTV